VQAALKSSSGSSVAAVFICGYAVLISAGLMHPVSTRDLLPRGVSAVLLLLQVVLVVLHAVDLVAAVTLVCFTCAHGGD
jgi:hypothetical protein